MNADERQEALARARTGDRTALGDLLDSYRPYATRIVQAQLKGALQSKMSTSDLVQESMLQAIGTFPDFRGESNEQFLTWFRKIVLRTAQAAVGIYRETAKRDVKRERRTASLADLVAGMTTSPSQRAIRHEEAAQMAEALDRLPEEMRTALILFFHEGRSHAEIGSQLGRTVGASRVLLLRALRLLRQEMGDATSG